jgi:hypothetical protein
MEVDQKILAKIGKLLALGQSPNANEAEVAMEKASQMLKDYNLEMEDVLDKPKESSVTLIPWGTNLDNAETILVSNICKLNLCSILQSGNRTILVGRAVNVAVVKRMVNYLTNAMGRIANEQCDGKPKEYKYNFRMGASCALVKRLITRYYAGLDEKSTALVICLQEEIDDFLKQFRDNIQKQEKKASIENPTAYIKGYHEGMKIGLDQQITVKDHA